MTNRLKCQNVELLTHTVKVLAIHGWDKTEDASFGYDAIAYFETRFSIPLEHTNIVSSLSGVGYFLNVELLTHTVKVLATHGWDKTEDASFGYDAIAYFETRFSIPLEHTNIVSSLLGVGYFLNVELLTHTVKVLATHGWDKTEDASFGYDAIAYFETRFSIPLEHTNIDSSLSGATYFL